MTGRFTEEQAIASVPRLTRVALESFIATRVIVPLMTDAGPMFREIDLARMDLLCELTQEFTLDEDALAIVISLIDQVHDMRGRLGMVMDAIAEQPEPVQRAIAECLARRSGS